MCHCHPGVWVSLYCWIIIIRKKKRWMSDLRRDAPLIWIYADVCNIWMTHSLSMRWRRTPNGTPVTAHLLSKDMENMMFNIWLHSNQLWQPICLKRKKKGKGTTWSCLQHKLALITPSSFKVAKALAVFAHICCHHLSSLREEESAIWQREQNRGFPGEKGTTRCFRRWQDYTSEKFS